MPRFSANLGFLWPDRPLLSRIAAAGAAGFGAVEFHWPYDVPGEAVRDACARADVLPLGVNTLRGDVERGEFGLGALPGREADFASGVAQALAFCAASGCTAIHCMAGKVPAGAAGARDTLLGNLRRAADAAARAGVTLLLEPMNARDVPGYFYATAAEGAAVVEAVGRPNVRLMLDCYHEGRGGGDVVAALDAHLPVVGHVQVAGVPGRGEPDGGDLDYRAVFAALDRLGYAGWVGAEYRPAGDTDAGLGWRERLGVEPTTGRRGDGLSPGRNAGAAIDPGGATKR